jgi:hypothetical protein
LLHQRVAAAGRLVEKLVAAKGRSEVGQRGAIALRLCPQQQQDLV